MEARTLKFVAEAVGGKLLHGNPQAWVRRVSSDSRSVASGDLFLAIKGERFDGHDFLKEVAAKGVAAMVVAQGREPKSATCPVIVVDDPRAALGRLAAAYRREHSLPVIAVGGSNGKTTTKDLIASVLRQKLSTLNSDASFNNDIGVPVTLLRLEKGHAAAVLEVGTNHPGELAPLVKMIQPRYGVITSIGREHLEFFGDIAGVAREEGTLGELLPGDGKLLINGDSEWSPAIIGRTRAAALRVGAGKGNDWRVTTVRHEKQHLVFQVGAPLKDFSGDYQIRLLGRHQAVNALFAIALGAELGLSPAEIRRGLELCEPAKMRNQLWEVAGVQLLEDCYNANADSMLAALQTLMDLPCKGRRIAILGDMAELGAASEAAHAEVGRRAAELGVGQLIAVGRMAGVMAGGARSLDLNRVFEFPDVEAAAQAAKDYVKAGDLVLLKASRSTRLERIAEALRSEGVRKS
ncbi:MAG: UDP-N-acetylmuramoyl-tripeptide--D-alanyl-D-alanine ligase [Verrucomicrobiota bacterium]